MKKKVCVVSLIFFLIDLVLKIIVLCFEDKFPLTVINKFFSLDKVGNTGAAFSMFSGHTFVLILIAVFVLVYLWKYIICDISSRLGFVSISMLIGGILGNLFDRIIYGEVIDFLSFNIFGYGFPIFNFADIFICVGVFLLIIDFIRGDRSGNSSK